MLDPQVSVAYIKCVRCVVYQLNLSIDNSHTNYDQFSHNSDIAYIRSYNLPSYQIGSYLDK